MDVIQAAGAVLWRRLSDELVQVALIHRPRYDDWSLPKGKVDPGESHIQAAYREVLEETGVKAIFGPEVRRLNHSVTVDCIPHHTFSGGQHHTQRIIHGTPWSECALN